MKSELKGKYTLEGENNLEKHWRRISREKRKCSEENSQQKYYEGKSRQQPKIVRIGGGNRKRNICCREKVE